MPEPVTELTDIQFMEEQTRKLVALLVKPKPEFVSWRMMFYGVIQSICERFEGVKGDAGPL